MLDALVFLFGSPLSVLFARVLSTLAALCPCHGDTACEATHRRAASAIAIVAIDARDPDEAAARLLGCGAHETGFRVERQANGGRAVTWWQIEVRRNEREALLADPIAAARLALRRAGGNLSAYAGCEQDCDTARDLRRYVASARAQLAAR